MEWVYLILAGLFEMAGVALINRVIERKDASSVLFMFLTFGGSFLFLSFAMETLPMGTAYAIWTGIGASGGALLGMILYGEPKDAKRLFCIALVLIGAVGLKAVG
ncbi:DMT family transporter [Bacillus fonticola]|uniref:DMT family transporter n=1 Tax=Bacillus fonticola TaxID=2728853 RepID=UPI00147355A4|nr:multidrug efflux SMR transporter [Bacillus fonticola]